MLKKWLALTVALLALSGAKAALAHSPQMHMYLGQSTIGVWNYFDPNFVSTFNLNTTQGKVTRKFYYLGLTLPDMFDEAAQNGINKLIKELYNKTYTYFDTIYGVPYQYTFRFRDAIISTSALYIKDATAAQMNTLMYFNSDAKGHDLAKLWAMACFAKNNNWGPWPKALIYGAYMHAVQDLYAHMVQQPSTFGHGYAINSEFSDMSDPLQIPEAYHELFATTYIPNWEFMKWTYSGYAAGAVVWGRGLDLWPWYNSNGTLGGGWQDIETGTGGGLATLRYFVDAANAVGYAGPGLTADRLKAYMHGWGIMMFLSSGYRGEKDEYTDMGGLFTHSGWTPGYYLREFAGKITLETGGVYASSLIPIPVLSMIIDVALQGLINEKIMDKFFAIYLPYGGGTQPWPYYLESVAGLDEGWNLVPDRLKPDYYENYLKYRSLVASYEATANVKKPQYRSTYNEVPGKAVALASLYQRSIDNGAGYLGYSANIAGRQVSRFQLSRKAGIVGAIFPIDSTREYDPEPGILDLHFERNGDYVYTTQTINMAGSDNITLKYDVVTTGTNDVRVMGKKLDIAEPTPLVSTGNMPTFARHQGNLTYSAQTAIQNQYAEFSFEARSKSKTDPPQYEQMISSDYRNKYNATTAISNNDNYKYWFKDGDPVRQPGQDPLVNPTQYWPYTLQLGVTVLNVNFESSEWYLKENEVLYSHNVSSPVAAKVGDEAGVTPRTGSWMYKISGTDYGASSDENDFCYWQLTGIPLVITENTYLSFWRYVKESPGNQGRIFVDGVTADGRNFRDWAVETYLCDQNGAKLHPCSPRPQTPGDGWRQYIVNLGPMAGNTVNLLIGYDDIGAESGTFTVYIDDLEIRQGFPHPNQWHAERFGNNEGSAVSWSNSSGGGADLVYNVWPTGNQWVNGPYLRYNIEPDITIDPNLDLTVSWNQYDMNHALQFMLLIKGEDNTERWLVYSANAPNHWANQGWVNMGCAETYNQWVPYSRNVNIDYCREYGIRGSSIKELRIGHFSYTGWSEGNHGGEVKDIMFGSAPLAAPMPPNLSGHAVFVPNKGVPGPGSGTYHAKLNWNCQSGSYPISKYRLETKDIYWVDRGDFYQTTWQDPWTITYQYGYRVKAFDTKGQISSWSNELIVKKPVQGDPIVAQAQSPEATAYSNGKKIIIDDAGRLHVTYTSGDTVYYTTSVDEGETWTPGQFVSFGQNPALALKVDGTPMLCWNTGSSVFTSEKSGGSWGESQLVYAGSPGEEISYLSFVADPTTGRTYSGWVGTSGGHSQVLVAERTPGNPIQPTPIRYDFGEVVFKSPCLALKTDGSLLTAWSKDGIIKYRDADGEVQLTDLGKQCIHPVVEAYGDKITVTWQESLDNLPDGFKGLEPGRYRIVEMTKDAYGWREPRIIAYSSQGDYQYPIVVAAGQYIYAGHEGDGDYDICHIGQYANGWEVHTRNISFYSYGISGYPCVAFDNRWPNHALFILWTETFPESTAGKVLAGSTVKVYKELLSRPVPSYEMYPRTDQASMYTVQRAGAFCFGTGAYQTVDYHPQELKYRFIGFNRERRYKLRAVFYRDMYNKKGNPADNWLLQPKCDQVAFGTVHLPDTTVVTLEREIPRQCLNDGAVDITIRKIKGEYAVCAALEIIEFTTGGKGDGGGIQTAESEPMPTTYRYELLPCAPNPFDQITTVRYQIARPGKVSLKVYNTLGQLVRTLVDGEQLAGSHLAKWDGKDGSGGPVANGVYLYRLEAGEFGKTRKMTLVK